MLAYNKHHMSVTMYISSVFFQVWLCRESRQAASVASECDKFIWHYCTAAAVADSNITARLGFDADNCWSRISSLSASVSSYGWRYVPATNHVYLWSLITFNFNWLILQIILFLHCCIGIVAASHQHNIGQMGTGFYGQPWRYNTVQYNATIINTLPQLRQW